MHCTRTKTISPKAQQCSQSEAFEKSITTFHTQTRMQQCLLMHHKASLEIYKSFIAWKCDGALVN